MDTNIYLEKEEPTAEKEDEHEQEKEQEPNLPVIKYDIKLDNGEPVEPLSPVGIGILN